jgi:tetratricopeptide (TPR) repeat protein
MRKKIDTPHMNRYRNLIFSVGILLLLLNISSGIRATAAQDPALNAKALVARAQKEAASIASASSRRDAMLAVANTTVILGDFAEAQAIIDSNATPDLKPRSYANLAKAVAKHGDQVAARKLFQKALDLTRALPGKLDNNLEKGLALQVIGEAMAASGEIEEALQLAETLGTTVYRSHVLASVALEQARAGNKELSNKTFSAARQFANKLEEALRDDTLAHIAEAQTQVGELGQASQTTTQTTVDWDQGIGQSAVARALADRGDVINLRKRAASTRDEASRAEILASLAGALYRQGDKTAALTAVHESFAAAAKVNDTSIRASVLCSIAEAQERGGDLDGAKSTLFRAVRAAKEAPSGLTLGDEFGRIAVVQALLGDTDAAFKTLREMTGVYAVQAYQEAARVYTHKSGVLAALHCLDSIDKSEHKVRWLIGMAEGSAAAK